MARVTRARLQTAYDAGRRAAADGSPPPDYIAGDGELLDAWDEGVADAQDGRPAARYGTDGRAHRAPARPRRSAGRARPKGPPQVEGHPQAEIQPRPDRETSGPDELGQRAASVTAGFHPVADTTSTLKRISLKPSTSNLGGFALGMIAYLAGIQYLRHGPGGPTAWFRAKFENKPLGAHSPTPAGSGLSASAKKLITGPASAATGGTFADTPAGPVPVTAAQPGGVYPGVPDVVGILTQPVPQSGPSWLQTQVPVGVAAPRPGSSLALLGGGA